MFDAIVLTAANGAQARGYRAELARRRKDGRLDPRVKTLAISDPGGRRVGSLGATVRALAKIDLTKRTLVCHSGGDARRTPGYAARGKAFIPLADGALFDEIVRNMSRLALPEAGVLVVCGDVAPRFDYAAADFSRPGVTGVGYWDGYDQAARHGVYVADRAGRVRNFLQKPSREAALAAGAFRRGKLAVDTGIFWIDAPTARKMLRAGWKTGDLYERFATELVRGFAPFWAHVAGCGELFHVGTSRELLALLGRDGVHLDGCGIPREAMDLAGGNVVTGVPANWPKKVRLAKNECLAALPVGRDGWVEVRYGLDDNFKEDGKWEKKLFRLDGKAVSLKELVPRVNAVRLAKTS